MSLAAAEVFAAPLRLSPRLISELGAGTSTLRAAVQGFRAAVIVYVGGEIDALNDDAWRLLLAEAAAFASAPQLFMVDVNSVDFMSCSSLLTLADEANRCREGGVAVCLVGRQPWVARSVAACGLSEVLPVHETATQCLQLVEQGREQAS